MRNIRQNSFICIILLSFLLFSCSSNDKKISKIDVAILMPTTGTNGDQGKRLSSIMAMGLEDGLQGHINLTTYDAPNKEVAQNMMDKIIKKKTKIVLGPMFAEVTASVIDKAEENNITLITLSNNPVLASSDIYVFGHAPMKQTERIINYFLSKDHQDIILLLPKTNYSETITNIVKTIASEKDANIHTEYYASEQDIIRASDEVAKIVDKINEDPDSLKPVIYISDQSMEIKSVLYALKDRNLDNKAIIAGDGRIDIELDKNVNFTFTGTLNYLDNNLNINAKEILGINHLTFLDLLAYDLGRMTSQYIGYGLDHPLFLARLNSKEVYKGVSGYIKFENGIAVRKYDIIQKSGNQYFTIDKAM